MRDELGGDQDRESPKRLQFRRADFLRKVHFQFADFSFDLREAGLQLALADVSALTLLQGLGGLGP